MVNDNNSPEEKLKKQIAKLEEREAQILAKKKQVKNRLNQQERKKRTKRLIEKGAILENWQGETAAEITPDQSLEILKQLTDSQERYEHAHKQLEELAKYKNHYLLLKEFTLKLKYENGTTVFDAFLTNQKAKKTE